MPMTAFEEIFAECAGAIANGDLIQKVSASDKEYHFQNWVMDRLDACGLNYDEPGRNTYPDFRLVDSNEGFEVKGLAWPGREANYDANSQVPMPRHNGREIFYVFGRYPKENAGLSEYPVTDLVICHGSFLNSDSEYEHKNDSFRGFGSYGDILIRDRKMYVVPTPFFLAEGTTGLSTLIVPEHFDVKDTRLVRVGDIKRTEVDQIVASYEFNLQTNKLVTHLVSNPNAGLEHSFVAYRLRGQGDSKSVSLSEGASSYANSLTK
jgi:hypothetical protein